MPESVEKTPLAEDQAAGATALLIIDMLNGWDFADADAYLAGAEAIAPRIAALAQRCRAAGVPVIFANDNHGRWRSDFREVVAMAMKADAAGARIARQLTPERQDYFVLKPKHSGFHATPLDLLLRHLGVRTLVVTGVSSDQCVLYTTADARMHDYEVKVPPDCVATRSDERNAAAIRHFADVLGVKVTRSTELALPTREEGGAPARR